MMPAVLHVHEVSVEAAHVREQFGCQPFAFGGDDAVESHAAEQPGGPIR